jgi:hypothetical protein
MRLITQAIMSGLYVVLVLIGMQPGPDQNVKVGSDPSKPPQFTILDVIKWIDRIPLELRILEDKIRYFYLKRGIDRIKNSEKARLEKSGKELWKVPMNSSKEGLPKDGY